MLTQILAALQAPPQQQQELQVIVSPMVQMTQQIAAQVQQASNSSDGPRGGSGPSWWAIGKVFLLITTNQQETLADHPLDGPEPPWGPPLLLLRDCLDQRHRLLRRLDQGRDDDLQLLLGGRRLLGRRLHNRQDLGEHLEHLAVLPELPARPAGRPAVLLLLGQSMGRVQTRNSRWRRSSPSKTWAPSS